jgi:hypothetical protein
MKSIQFYALLFMIFVLINGFALAETGLPWVGLITRETSEEVSIFVLPDGSGHPLSQAMLFGGQLVDSGITVGLVDGQFSPIPYFPGVDIWLDSETPTSSSCANYLDSGFVFEGVTDPNGEISFTGPLAGGGWTEGPIWVYLIGNRAMDPDQIQHPPLTLRFNSADINADAVVDLGQWYRVCELIDNCYLSLMRRGGVVDVDFSGLEKKIGQNRKKKLEEGVMNTPLIEISSTEIRRRIAESGDLSMMLDQKVADYIADNALYSI